MGASIVKELIPEGVRGNKRSKVEMLELEEKFKALVYSENPRYAYEEILAIVQVPKRTLDRYRAKIWKEDAPKREKTIMENMKQKMSNYWYW